MSDDDDDDCGHASALLCLDENLDVRRDGRHCFAQEAPTPILDSDSEDEEDGKNEDTPPIKPLLDRFSPPRPEEEDTTPLEGEEQGEHYYGTDEDEFEDRTHEPESKAFFDLCGICDDCVMDYNATPRNGDDPDDNYEIFARHHACDDHSRAWAFFSDYAEIRNRLYYPPEADTEYPNFAPQNAHCRDKFLPRLDVRELASYMLHEYDVLKDGDTPENRRRGVYWRAQRHELMSIDFHGPWNWNHLGMYCSPSTHYTIENGFFGPWRPLMLRFYRPEVWYDHKCLAFCLNPDNYHNKED